MKLLHNHENWLVCLDYLGIETCNNVAFVENQMQFQTILFRVVYIIKPLNNDCVFVC